MPPTGTLNLPVHTVTSVASVGPNTDDEKIWTQILSEVSAKGANNTPQGSVLFLGDRQSGKSWLLSRLEKREASGRGSALEYHFLNVHADFRDASAGVAPGETVTLPVWVLDGDESFAPLVKFALTLSLSRSVVVLCASLTQPGAILSSLNRWSKLIDAQIQNIFDKSTIAEARQAQELFWQEYVEPLDSSMHSDKIPSMETEQPQQIIVIAEELFWQEYVEPLDSSMHSDKIPSMETEQVLLPLQQNILTRNSGVALVVVLTKCDLAHSELSDEQLDRVQFHVRKFCMQHGAALVYTSAKEEKNTALLYKYLVHRVCGVPFTTPAHVVEKDAIFVPAGWDNEKKLDIIRETLPDADQPLEMPRERHQIREQMVEAEEEQAFLQKLASVEMAAPKKTPQQKPPTEGADGNSPLVSFFNNLLKTKEGQSVQAARPVGDPQAQLQRMLEQVNSAAANQSSNNEGSSQV
uniref:Dynein light intermediate chain n=1 Tax=Ascaris lumbricoides TaxID=6252 RepID=A0A0M3IGJ4_ASCLU